MYLTKKIFTIYISVKWTRICCGCDIIVVYDVTDCWTEMIRSISANSLASYIVTHSGHYEDSISDFETESRNWGSAHYCMEGDLISSSQSHQQFVGKKTCGLDCSAGITAGCVGLAPGLTHITGPHITSYKCCLAFHQHNGYHKL